MSRQHLRGVWPRTSWTCLLAVAVVVFSTCVGTALGTDESPKPGSQEDPSRAEYYKAKNIAVQGRPEGYRRLFKMATNDQSAEWSEVANRQIWYLLHKNAQTWLRAVAPLDDPSQREFLAWSVGSWSMIELLPEESGGIPTFRRDVLVKLRAFKGTPREQALAKFMMELFSSLSDEKQVKPTTP
jgi:hypothetical protein